VRSRSWRECANPSLRIEDFEGQACHLAIDLASRTDLAALAIVFPREDPETGKTSYTAFARCYVNDAAVMEARNPSYPGWAADGFLTVTPGNETDFGTIESDILDLCRRFDVQSVAYDPWAATQLAQRLGGEGVPVFEFRANTQNFSEPTKELDAAIGSHRIQHDGNPVLAWCISNIVGRYDVRSNVYPRKARSEQKIDAAIALIMGIARCMTDTRFVSVYESRGLAIF
jgi:phage terminase large subunit-like protein